MSDLFTLRKAREEDMPYVHSYAYREGMDNPPFGEGLSVAVNSDDIPVGFVRIAVVDGVAYVNPVVVAHTWRGFGVGRALIEDALRTHGALRLVARGASVPFYRAMGFGEAAWEDIADEIASECTGCELRPECGPLPMRFPV